MNKREDLRTVAIVAHVDHGKTTLVDALFRQGGLFREGQAVAERVMDSNDQERERGITILAKSTSVVYGDLILQLVDTPGHADFGAEVERTLRMVDGVLLLVDAAEGPLPQTRFVLRKALGLGLPALLAINKIDRQDARPREVLDEVYDLFIELGANESQLEFPVLYTDARAGTATADLSHPGEDLQPLVAALAQAIPCADDRSDEPFLMQVNSLAHDDYVGRLVVGRVIAGRAKTNDTVFVRGGAEEKVTRARVTGLFSFQGVERNPLPSARSGDVVAIAGFDDISIGDTLAGDEEQPPLPPIAVDEPTVEMVFQVNDGPLAGRSGGKFLTSRHLRERLARETYANMSIRVEPGASPEQFRVRGRGELQLAVLIETLRREKYELCVRPPVVVTRDGAAGREEPIERLVIDVPAQHLGAVNELVGRRRGKLIEQRIEGDRVRLEFDIPTRGLLGLRGHLLTITRGTAIASSVFEGWVPWGGPIVRRQNGALVSDRAGKTTPYALFHLQPRGVLFVPPSAVVYEGMIVGSHNRDNDLNVNPVREKKLTNVRAAGKDEQILLTPPQVMNLEQALEWMRDDEMLEITPDAIRLRKAVLQANRRPARE
jgi:GTP-binding protein